MLATNIKQQQQQENEWKRSPDWHVTMFYIRLWRLLWVYCLGHTGVRGNDRAHRVAWKAADTNGLPLGISEVLRSLRHYLRAQNQEYHIIDLLVERRRMRKRSTIFLERTREGHGQSDQQQDMFQRQYYVNFPRDRVACITVHFLVRVDIILNWSGPKWRDYYLMLTKVEINRMLNDLNRTWC